MPLRLHFILALSAMLLTLTSYGQAFKAGVLGGISTSQVGGDGYSGFNKAGINLGVFLNTALSKEVDMQFEIEYMQKGARKNPDTEKGDYTMLLIRLDYVQVPILVKYHHKNFYLEGGGYAGFLVNFYLENETGVRTEQFQEDPARKRVKDTDFGVLAGLGYEINDHFTLNSRFLQTVGNVKEFESGAVFWLRSGWSNSVIAFTFRYEFGGRS